MRSALQYLRFPRLKRVDVSLTGGWRDDPPPSWSAGRPAWAGVAIAAEPIVALFFAETRSEIRWLRCRKQNAAYLPVDIGYSSDSYGEQRVVTCGGLRESAWFKPGDRPILTFFPTFRTGELIQLAVMPHDTETRFFMLVIARSDTRGRRCGLWHLRKSLRDQATNGWDRAFAYGRTGKWPKDSV